MASPPHDDRSQCVLRLVRRSHGPPAGHGRSASHPAVLTAGQLPAALVRLDLLRRFRPHREAGFAPWRHVLGPIGAALLGQENRDEKKRGSGQWQG